MKNARTTAFGCYLVFRHADRAFQRGQLSESGLASVAKALRTRVEPVWAQIFPGQEPAAYTWVLERLRVLEADHVLTPEAAARMRDAARPKAGGSDNNNWGALALLWRVHVLYLLATDVAEQVGLPDTALTGLREKLHHLALAALTREVNGAGTEGARTLHAVVEEARGVARALMTEKVVDETEGQALLSSLGGTVEAGEPAKLSTGEGNCLVCGEGFVNRPIVYCGACETPHHPDCWTWVGRCSMFACGCVDSSPRPGATKAPRFNLEPTPPPRPMPSTSQGNPLSGLMIAALILGAMLLSSLF